MIVKQIANLPIWSVGDADGHWAVGRVVRCASGQFIASMNGDGPVRALEDQLGRTVTRLQQATFDSLDDAAAYFEGALA